MQYAGTVTCPSSFRVQICRLLCVVSSSHALLLSLSLFFYLSISRSISLYISLYTYIYISLSLSRSRSLSLSLSLSLFLSLSISLALSLSLFTLCLLYVSSLLFISSSLLFSSLLLSLLQWHSPQKRVQSSGHESPLSYSARVFWPHSHPSRTKIWKTSEKDLEHEPRAYHTYHVWLQCDCWKSLDCDPICPRNALGLPCME